MRQQMQSRWKVAVMAVALLGMSTAAYADRGEHGREREHEHHWWRSPPAEPVADVDFLGGKAEDASVRTYVLVDGVLSSKSKVRLGQTTFDASVAGGVLTINAVKFSQTDAAGVTTEVALPDFTADLTLNVFGSS
ncbi:MAG: hypothetical protein KDA41_00095, partial [Planctomycetales bacterium]|nr:hypothetical protein [Planctomycetales bacterium]